MPRSLARSYNRKACLEGLDLSIAEKYPNKLVVISEAGWATESNGFGIPRENVNQETQRIYYKSLTNWSKKNNILTFVFEAFDEPWKGGGEATGPNEVEKHWGIYFDNRKAKF